MLPAPTVFHHGRRRAGEVAVARPYIATTVTSFRRLTLFFFIL